MPSLSRFRSIPITVSARRKGLVIMLASAGIFAVMGLLMKLLGPEYRVWDIAIYRFVGGAVILGALFRFNRHLLRPARPRLMLVRGVVGSIAFLSITYAIRSIPFSTAMVLFYSFPAFAALFSTCISPERLSLYEIICILAALVGWGNFRFSPGRRCDRPGDGGSGRRVCGIDRGHNQGFATRSRSGNDLFFISV